jgi:hypothetical protein
MPRRSGKCPFFALSVRSRSAPQAGRFSLAKRDRRHGYGIDVDLVDAVDERGPAYALGPLGGRVDGLTIRSGRVSVLPAVRCVDAIAGT